MNGDGTPDLFVGAPKATTHSAETGATYVYSGADQGLLYTLSGTGSFDEFGFALALLSDIDGDGVIDLAVGAPGGDSAALDGGDVRIVSGASGTAIRTHRGSSPGGRLGTSVANAGRVDGDSVDDLLIGVPNDDGAAANAGLVLLRSGATGALLDSFSGSSAGDQFGHAVVGLGDVNGDGFRDQLVGAPGGSYVRVLSGANGSTLWAIVRDLPFSNHTGVPGPFGNAASAAGDVNADGYADFAVGYPEYSGVWVFSGADASVLALYTGAIIEPNFGISFPTCLGWSVACVGDLNGDGSDELAIGAPQDSIPPGDGFTVGSVVVVTGTWEQNTVLGSEAGGDSLGWCVSAAGDLNGDGHADYAIGAPTDGPGSAGRVSVRSGVDRSSIRELFGMVAGDQLGRAVANAGDVDGDAVDDLVVGAHRASGMGTWSGGAWIFSGSTGLVLHSFEGSAASDFFGTSVAGVGDIDGDGRGDVAVGAPQVHTHPSDNGYSQNPGYVRVFSGQSGALIHELVGVTVPDDDFPGMQIGEAFGFSVLRSRRLEPGRNRRLRRWYSGRGRALRGGRRAGLLWGRRSRVGLLLGWTGIRRP